MKRIANERSVRTCVGRRCGRLGRPGAPLGSLGLRVSGVTAAACGGVWQSVAAWGAPWGSPGLRVSGVLVAACGGLWEPVAACGVWAPPGDCWGYWGRAACGGLWQPVVSGVVAPLER